MPSRTASSASSGRAVSTSSSVRLVPRIGSSDWIPPAPGMMPIATSGKPTLLDPVISLISQASASSSPPPKAVPFTAATKTVLLERIRSMME